MNVKILIGQVADFLEANPERWAQEVFTDTHRGVACVAGWLYITAKENSDSWVYPYSEALNCLCPLIQRDRPKKKSKNEWKISQWNDSKGRTVQQVVALLREAMGRANNVE